MARAVEISLPMRSEIAGRETRIRMRRSSQEKVLQRVGRVGDVDGPVGVGVGQMSRVNSARIASWKALDASKAAGELTSRTEGAVVASDAFFPFSDGLLLIAETGVTAVIQPGGSIRDAEVIAAADEKGLAMVFTGIRHFRH